MFACALLVLANCVALPIGIVFTHRRGRAARVERCRWCGYPTHGLGGAPGSVLCPECGNCPDPPLLRRKGVSGRGHRIIGYCLITLVLLIDLVAVSVASLSALTLIR
jgi:hypothetical protein